MSHAHATVRRASTDRHTWHTYCIHHQIHTNGTPSSIGDSHQVSWCRGCCCEQQVEPTHTMSSHASVQVGTREHPNASRPRCTHTVYFAGVSPAMCAPLGVLACSWHPQVWCARARKKSCESKCSHNSASWCVLGWSGHGVTPHTHLHHLSLAGPGVVHVYA